MPACLSVCLSFCLSPLEAWKGIKGAVEGSQRGSEGDLLVETCGRDASHENKSLDPLFARLLGLISPKAYSSTLECAS